MSLRLLVDEDSQAKYLINLLLKVGHEVLTVNDAGLSSLSDGEVLKFARRSNRAVLTRNCQDFRALHKLNPTHCGILVIRQSNDQYKDMAYRSVVKAIANIEASVIRVDNQFIELNHWQY